MARTANQKRISRQLNVSLSDDLRLRYLERGNSLDVIAKLYEVSRPTVARWLDDLGITRRPRGRPRKDGTIASYAVDLL